MIATHWLGNFKQYKWLGAELGYIRRSHSSQTQLSELSPLWGLDVEYGYSMGHFIVLYRFSWHG